MSIDDIRNELEDDFVFDEEEIWEEPADTDRIILGMTPVQRFVIALLLFLTIVIISTFCLLVTGKIALPL